MRILEMRRLDPAQKAAATSTAAIQLTLAGPGAGKTSTLTGRFIHLVRQGVDPARILGLTFTRKAADEMARRIAGLLELTSPARLNLMTFHAFAFRLLKRNPVMAGLPERFELWDEARQRHDFTSRRMWWNEEVDILEIIGGAKERLLDAAGLAKLIGTDDTWLDDDLLTEAVNYFRVYEAAQRTEGAIDFADMVPLLAKAMAGNEDYRRSITGGFDHVLVDEYQDVNPGQVALLDHFIRDSNGMWAVGDDDQTLYAFRASDIRYVLNFRQRHPGADLHILDRNYRSSPEIVDAAKRLVRNNRERIDKDYQPVVTEPGEIVIRGYSSPDIEARQVARAMAELLAAGTPPHEIAVLYRSGAIGLSFQAGIAFEVRGGADVWQSAAARLTVGALLYLRDGPSAAAMSRLGSNKRAEIVRADLDMVRRAVRGDLKLSCAHVQRIVGDAVPQRAAKRELAEWQSIVDAVITLARSCSTLEELESRIAEQSRALRNPPERTVVLSTIHSAKGLEWETVFLAGLEDGVLPHVNTEDIEEERRVAYVGLTRARRRVGLTYSGERYGEHARPSPFLYEIAGKGRRYCTWTGPRSDGADEQLPLTGPQQISPGDQAVRPNAPRPGHATSRSSAPRGHRAADAVARLRIPPSREG